MQQTTETGIDISNFIAEKAAGTVALRKGAANSGNYIFVKTAFTVQLVNGVPTIVESPNPQLANINRQSLADMRAVLAQEEAAIAAKRTQLDAIEADMNALDLL